MESVPSPPHEDEEKDEEKLSVLANVTLDSDNAPRYLHGFKLFVVMLALLLSMFLVWPSLTPMLCLTF